MVLPDAAPSGERTRYFLYAASNFGSLAGLLMYPLVVEPLLPFRIQSRYWTYGYMGFVVLVAICVVLLMRRGEPCCKRRRSTISVNFSA